MSVKGPKPGMVEPVKIHTEVTIPQNKLIHSKVQIPQNKYKSLSSAPRLGKALGFASRVGLFKTRAAKRVAAKANYALQKGLTPQGPQISNKRAAIALRRLQKKNTKYNTLLAKGVLSEKRRAEILLKKGMAGNMSSGILHQKTGVSNSNSKRLEIRQKRDNLMKAQLLGKNNTKIATLKKNINNYDAKFGNVAGLLRTKRLMSKGFMPNRSLVGKATELLNQSKSNTRAQFMKSPQPTVKTELPPAYSTLPPKTNNTRTGTGVRKTTETKEIYEAPSQIRVPETLYGQPPGKARSLNTTQVKSKLPIINNNMYKMAAITSQNAEPIAKQKLINYLRKHYTHEEEDQILIGTRQAMQSKTHPIYAQATATTEAPPVPPPRRLSLLQQQNATRNRTVNNKSLKKTKQITTGVSVNNLRKKFEPNSLITHNTTLGQGKSNV